MTSHVPEHASKISVMLQDLVKKNHPNFRLPLVGHPHAFYKHHDRWSVRTFSATPSVSSTIFNTAGQSYRFKFDKKSAFAIKSAIFRFRISASGGYCDLVPSPFFLDLIVLCPNNGAGQMIQWNFGASMYFDINGAMNDVHLKHYLSRQINCDPQTYHYGSRLASGASRDFYLPLPSGFFDMVQPLASEIEDDMVFIMYFRGGAAGADGILRTGSTGTPSLDALSFIIFEHLYPPADHQMLTRHWMNNTVVHPLLNVFELKESLTLTPSTKSLINLQNIVGSYSFLVFFVRSGTTTTADTILDFQDLGPRALIDIETPNGESMLGNGTPITLQHFREVISPAYLPGDLTLKKNVYVIPFGHIMSLYHDGLQDGDFPMHGTKRNLAITPGAQRVDESISIATSVNATAGYYAILVQDLETGQSELSAEVAYNGSPVTAVNATQLLSKLQVTVALSSGSLAASPMVITWSSPVRHDYRLKFRVINQSLTAANTNITSTTTAGSNGFAAAGTFTVSMYWYYVRSNYIAGGKIHTADRPFQDQVNG